MQSSISDQTPERALNELGIDPDAWQTCREHLERVSRTFSKPIGMLPGVLRVAATCGYLLCRITDTIEDEPDLTHEERDQLFARFLGVVERDIPADEFEHEAKRLTHDDAYARLARDMSRVMDVFSKLPTKIVETSTQWIGEMTRGMRIYAGRPANAEGVRVLHTVRDLERYCHFVAGTVGHMMTELFVFHLEESGDAAQTDVQTMRANAERFGLGLQLVNILKDQTDDYEEGWCFVPRTLLDGADFESPDALFSANISERGHSMLDPLFERASSHLDAALKYTLAIPSDQREIRIACLLPLWMARQTLNHARGNDAMFRPDTPVKISRDSVAETVAECTRHADDDAYLSNRYEQLSPSC